ncbi:hypothetical protein BH09PLA1_BH09PLA1_12990 [soil metagenome]
MSETPPTPLQLPHTANCLVCGRNNPHGLHLDLFVMPSNGLVVAEFIAGPSHVGFEGLVHGGILSTVMDEAMTWAATWNIKRFCLCGELSVRFRQSVIVGQKVRVEALVDFSRHKLVEPSAKLFDEFHKLLATATGKYVPVSPDQHGQFVRTFIESDRTSAAASLLGLRSGADALSETTQEG